MRTTILLFLGITVFMFGYTYNLSKANSGKIIELEGEKVEYKERIDTIISKLDSIESCLSRVESRIGNNGK